MLICPNCGTENSEIAKFCLECGISIKKELLASKQATEYSAPITNYPPRHIQPVPRMYVSDEVNPGVYCCSACVPIAGFVIYFALKDDKPKSAENVLVLSIISIILAFFFGIVS